jgi:outer membrane protein assembly factor BamE (lipoprotein component of BamABCDE complex)
MDRIDSNINWDEVIKKEARGLDDEDLGEVHEVGPDYVLTQKGTVHKHRYQLPKNLAVKFDGNKLWFKITKDEADGYKSVHDGEVSEIPVADNTIYNKSNIDSNNIINGTSSDTYSNINWDEVIKKEARGLDDEDLGEVHEVGPDYVLTQKGTVHKHRYQLPKNLAVKFDGNKLWFKITKDEADGYKIEN